MDWIVYYDDRGKLKSFTSEDGPPWAAPSTNVMLITVADEQVGRKLVYRADFYWWSNVYQTWLAGDRAGLYQHLFFDQSERGQPTACLMGAIVPNDVFDRFRQEALADPRLPPKSAKTHKELELEDVVVRE